MKPIYRLQSIVSLTSRYTGTDRGNKYKVLEEKTAYLSLLTSHLGRKRSVSLRRGKIFS